MFKNFIKSSYFHIFPSYEKTLGKLLNDCETVLDAGCGTDSVISPFSNNFYSVGIDIYEPSIKISKEKGIHNEYLIGDVRELNKHFKPKSFDVVIASDVIEHLKKEEGYKMLEQMETIAKKRIIIFTPEGFLPTADYYENQYLHHKSGWSVEEMQDLGFKVQGINGLKIFHKTKLPNRMPIVRNIWRFLTDTSCIFTKNKPKLAFQILCVKDLE